MGVLVFLVNCQKEEDILNPDSQTKAKGGFKISIVDGHQVAQNKHLTTKLERIKDARNQGDISSQKNLHDIEHGFTINTERVKYIEKDDGYHSYTFPILRDLDNGLLENLVFSSQDDGTYDTFIVTYNLTIDQQKSLLAGLEVDMEGKVTKTEIDDLGLPTDLMGKVNADCVEVVSERCGYGNPNHPGGRSNGAYCPGYEYDRETVCPGGGGPLTNNNTNGDNTNTDTDTSSGHVEAGGTGTGGTTSPTCTRNCIDEVCSSSLALTNLTSSLNLSPTIATCLEDDEKCDQVTTLSDYIENNPDNLEFAKFTAEAICDGGMIDYDDKIILDSTFISNQKAKCVYDILKTHSQNIFRTIINKHFDSDKTSLIRFKIGATPNGEDAFTQGKTNGGLSTYDILLDPTTLTNASTFEVALMLIHESIHAELLNRCVKLGIINSFLPNGNPVFTNTQNSYSTYATLFALIVYQYRDYYVNNPTGTGDSQWNHDLFTVFNYRTKISEELLDLFPFLDTGSPDFVNNVNLDPSIIGGPYTAQQLVDNISWIGLEETQEFINTIQNGPIQSPTALAVKNYVETVVRTKFISTCN